MDIKPVKLISSATVIRELKDVYNNERKYLYKNGTPLRHSRCFSFKEQSSLTIISIFQSSTLRHEFFHNDVISYKALLEVKFNKPVSIIEDGTSRILKIKPTTGSQDLKIIFKFDGSKYPSNLLQPKYFGLENIEIPYNNYINIVTEKINSDQLLTKEQKGVLIDMLNGKNYQKTNAGKLFGTVFVKKIATNFSEIIGPLLLIPELKEYIETINNVKIKFPSKQNAKHDYEIIDSRERNSSKWFISVKGGVAAATQSLVGKVNTIKFNNIFNNSSAVIEKKYGKIQTIVAKNIIDSSIIEGSIKAMIQILNLNNSISNRISLNLFVARKNIGLSKDEREYVINYIKNLTDRDFKNKDIDDENIVEYLKNISKDNQGTFEELSFACERAITKDSEMSSNYQKFILDYLKENSIFIQQIAIQESNLKINFKMKNFDNIEDWYFLRSKNSPGHIRDKLGIDPIGR